MFWLVKPEQYSVSFAITSEEKIQSVLFSISRNATYFVAHTDKTDIEVFSLFVFLGICFLTNVKLIYFSFLQAVFSYNYGLIK